jgi:hypothetical protein
MKQASLFACVASVSLVAVSCGTKSKSAFSDTPNDTEEKPTAAKGEISAEIFAKSPALKNQLQSLNETVSKGAANGNMSMDSLKPKDMQTAGSSSFGLADEDNSSYAQKLKDCIKKDPEVPEDKDADGVPSKASIKFTCKDIIYKFGSDATISYDYKFSLEGEQTLADLDDSKKGLLGGYESQQNGFKSSSEFTIKYQGKEAKGKSNYTQSFKMSGKPNVDAKQFTQSFAGNFDYAYTPFNSEVFGQASGSTQSTEKSYSGKSQIWNESILTFETFPTDSVLRNASGLSNFKELNYSGFFKFQNESTEKAEYVFQYKGEKLVPGTGTCANRFASGTVTYSAAKGAIVYEFSCERVAVKIDGKEVDTVR